MKTYRYSPSIGKSRHCISYHDGTKTHADGSPFFDLVVCRNLPALRNLIQRLKKDGYSLI